MLIEGDEAIVEKNKAFSRFTFRRAKARKFSGGCA